MSKRKVDAIENNSSLFDKTIVSSHIMDSAQKLCQADFLFSKEIANYAKCLRENLRMIAIFCLYPEQETIKGIKKPLEELQNKYDSERISEKIIEELRTTIDEKANRD